jgi:23S rRNA pseudouridine1911/1915/1917 synthase
MLEILKKEKDYLVINKPSGLIVHSDGRSEEETLCDILVKQYPEIENVGEPLIIEGKEIKRPGIVHRLDKETSGVMLVARTDEGFEFLKNKFKNREIEKTYHAFVWGNIKEDNGLIDEPIGRSKKDFRRWFAGSKARGKLREAVTEYKVLKRIENKEITFVEAKPKTGRTHQIRVHFKHMYNPLVGDMLYGSREYALGFNRLALHARSISFIDKKSDKVEYIAEYPIDFIKALDTFK